MDSIDTGKVNNARGMKRLIAAVLNVSLTLTLTCRYDIQISECLLTAGGDASFS